jgi:hypothetical protein
VMTYNGLLILAITIVLVVAAWRELTGGDR